MLVNISQDIQMSGELVESGACNKLFDYLREGAVPHPDLVVMVLSNLTQTDKGARAALQVRFPTV